MLVLEEQHLLPIEQESQQDIQISLHAYQLPDVKLAYKLVKLLSLEAQMSIRPAKPAHMAKTLQPGRHRFGKQTSFSSQTLYIVFLQPLLAVITKEFLQERVDLRNLLIAHFDRHLFCDIPAIYDEAEVANQVGRNQDHCTIEAPYITNQGHYRVKLPLMMPLCV